MLRTGFINVSPILSSIHSRGIKKRVTNDLIISPDINNVIIGLLLGDARVDRQNKNHSARLCFEQGAIHKDYLFHLFDIFKPFCGMPSPSFRSKFHKKTGNFNDSYLFKTLSYPCFNYHHSLFYPDKVKIVPSTIEQLLTPVSMAYWALDDGYKSNKNFGFCTDSFTLDEVQLLTFTLQKKFSVLSSLHNVRKNQYRIYIKSESMVKFKELVCPHFHPSMMYKLA